MTSPRAASLRPQWAKLPGMKAAPRLAFLLLTAGFTAAAAQTYTFTTLAGGAYISGYDTADGTGSAARFASPIAVAVDKSGNVFVADPSHAAIRKITADGVVTTLLGGFTYPTGVAVDDSGNV